MGTATLPLDTIREQAACWVDRQFAGRLSEEELAEFDTWRRADESHDECVRMSIASRWAEQMRDGDFARFEREAFAKWLLADPRNMAEFGLAAHLFTRVGNPARGQRRNCPGVN